MAVVQAYLSIEMWGIDTFYGSLLRANSNVITVSDGIQTSNYTGSFSYDIFENIYGTFRGYSEYYRGNLVVEVGGFSFDASIAQLAIDTGNADHLLESIGVGRGTIYGSAFPDKLAGFFGNDTIFGNGGDFRGIVTDFNPGIGKIVIGRGATGMADLSISERSGEVYVAFSNVEILVLNQSLAEMSDAGNFLF